MWGGGGTLLVRARLLDLSREFVLDVLLHMGGREGGGQLWRDVSALGVGSTVPCTQQSAQKALNRLLAKRLFFAVDAYRHSYSSTLLQVVYLYVYE